MKLYLCTFRVDTHHYMGRTVKGEKDYPHTWFGNGRDIVWEIK